MADINQNQILDKIIHEIYKIHPIKNPRNNAEIYQNSVMEINFVFGATYDNKPITAIGFLDGNENHRTTTLTSYRLSEYVDSEIVTQLISFLIKDFPYISDFSLDSKSFSLDFEYPFELENEEGISCNKIILKFRARDNELISLLNNYLAIILSNFTEQLSNTKTFQNKYTEYCNNLKKEIITSATNEEIDKMIGMLPIEMKKELLKSMPNQYFIQFYNDFQNQDEKSKQKKLSI